MNLFGGAIHLDLPLDTFRDASHFRPVPDFQEVFVSDVNDESIIVELLEHQPEMTVQDYFMQLAKETLASESEIIEFNQNCLLGIQKATQGSAPTYILLGLRRLPEHTTDCLVSWNCPKACNYSLQQFASILESFQVVDSSLFHKN